MVRSQVAIECNAYDTVSGCNTSIPCRAVVDYFGNRLRGEEMIPSLYDLGEIISEFKSMLRVIDQVSLAEVTSALKLSRAQEDTICDRVKAMTKSKSVELAVTINPDLIGGVIIKVGSQVVDASIRGQLRRLKSSLTAGV